MRKPKTQRIVLSAREVVAAGSPFKVWGETFADPGVALDELRSFEAIEPTVLRVSAEGFKRGDVAPIVGEWLYEPGRCHAPLRNAQWTADDRSRRWSSARGPLVAWEQCERADWSLHASSVFGVDARLVAMAACEIATTSLADAEDEADGPDDADAVAAAQQAVAIAETWASGGKADLIRAQFLADDAWNDTEVDEDNFPHDAHVQAETFRSVRSAWSAVACAVCAWDGGHDRRMLATYAMQSATYASGIDDPLGLMPRDDARENMRLFADIVRHLIPTLSFLRAIADRRI